MRYKILVRHKSLETVRFLSTQDNIFKGYLVFDKTINSEKSLEEVQVENDEMSSLTLEIVESQRI